MIITRRFVLVLALMFWQGGFMFYGAVTVPVVRARLDRGNRGKITQEVTQWMNLAGTIALLGMMADVVASPLGRKRWRWVAWLVMAVPHPALVLLHREMSRQMAVPGFDASDLAPFFSWHRVYLLINTVQWAAGMVFAILSLKAWREEDRAGR